MPDTGTLESLEPSPGFRAARNDVGVSTKVIGSGVADQ